MTADHPWIVIGPEPHVSTCTRCGTTLDIALPMPITKVTALLRAFVRTHRTCQDLTP